MALQAGNYIGGRIGASHRVAEAAIDTVFARDHVVAKRA